MKLATMLLLHLLCSELLIPAQDTDTIVLKNDERKFTVLSQIEDPGEASAFLAILNAKNPAERYALSQDFVKRYPSSWLLPQVFDVSARCAIDLGKFAAALIDGRFSLRLMPENPSLLILMANVEAQQSQFTVAFADAGNALEYLDQIERPPSTNQSEWNAIRPQLKASAYFARARVQASRGLAERKTNLLHNAVDDLNRAAAWNPSDPEIFYLRAIVEIQLTDRKAAASDFAFVFQSTSPLRENAKTVLSILSRELAEQDTPFESFVKTLPDRTVEAKLRQEVPPKDDSRVLSQGYASPEACRTCHEKEYTAWRTTGMARMLQEYRPENVFGDFSPATQYSESTQKGLEPEVIRLGFEGRPYFELRSSGNWSRYYVDFTIGSKWQQGYVTKLPDGQMHVLPIEYNLLQKKWINYWKMIDPPGSARANIADFPKLTAATNYQQNCAICHTSQLKADLTLPDSMRHAGYLQPGIDCEMCHGPSAWHIQQVAKGALEHADADQPPVNFRKVNNRAGVRVCAQCHQQSAVRKIGDGGEMNYATQGSFVPATWLRPFDAFSRKAFYKDGRFRETTFIVEAFTRSACYRRGEAQCATCHSPHLGDFETNQTSIKLPKTPNEMCLGCHSEYRNRVAEHSHHSPQSEASQCVTCHMPRVVNALLFKARSHQVEVPSADLTERFGQQDSPNTCLTCHSEKSVTWAKEQLAAWRH